MKNPLLVFQHNPVALIVLLSLVFCLITSLIILTGKKPLRGGKNWTMVIFPILSVLGLPGAIDLLGTGWLTTFCACVILIILVLNMVMPVLIYINKKPSRLLSNWYTWAIPLLLTAGLIVAGYLTYMEMTSTVPVCGPILPGCETVQTSRYARLFGFLPIAVIGLAGYTTILLTWLVRTFGKEKIQYASSVALWAFSFFGVLFSTYLTYLEAFVIHATCSWCITSAVLMMLILWVTTPMAHSALVEEGESDSMG
jgi:uncharacterized membrane protein